MRLFIFLTLPILFLACQPSSDNTSDESEKASYTKPSHHSESLTKVFDAHGGYEQWSKMKTLSYLKGEEYTITNLQNRKIKLEDAERTIGFDGTNVWVAPDTAEIDRARFYHNLYFYFYAMPFVVGDPGAKYEEMTPMELEGKTCGGIKVSYGEDVGDAPDDNYIIWYDPETFQMEWLMYTVTYRSGEPSDEYRLIKYQDWQEIGDLLLPTTLQWYQYDGENVGDPRGNSAEFKEVKISEDYPEEDLFEMPEGAVIAPR